MQQKDLVLKAAKAIKDRLYPGPKSYVVGTILGVIVCLPKYQLPEGFILVRKYTASQLENGLTAMQWHDLETALIFHFKKEPSCQNNLTP